jgi:hypothetical protein
MSEKIQPSHIEREAYVYIRQSSMQHDWVIALATATPACPPSDQRLWIIMQQAAVTLVVSEMVVRRLIAQKILPAKQIVKFAPWMIERTHLELPAVRKEIRRVQLGRRLGWAVNKGQTGLFSDSHEAQP